MEESETPTKAPLREHIDLSQGFRRVGWVLSFPIALIAAAVIIYPYTLEFSGYDLDLIEGKYAIQLAVENGSSQQEQTDEQATRTIPSQSPTEFMAEQLGLGTIRLFSSDQIVAILEEERIRFQPSGPTNALLVPEAQLRELRIEGKFPYRYEVELPKRNNPFRFAWMSIVALAGIALIIQGGISLLAWIVRGFVRA